MQTHVHCSLANTVQCTVYLPETELEERKSNILLEEYTLQIRYWFQGYQKKYQKHNKFRAYDIVLESISSLKSLFS
jgi:hypothetical protein